MGLGHRVLRLRRESQMTQSELAVASGLTVSYLSRVENNHVTPSVATLSKLATAVRQPLTAFFADGDSGQRENRCPVSLCGKCILDQHFVTRGRQVSADPKSEGYSAEQLMLLQLCNYLLHTGNREVVASLTVTLRSLLALVDRSNDAPGV